MVLKNQPTPGFVGKKKRKCFLLSFPSLKVFRGREEAVGPWKRKRGLARERKESGFGTVFRHGGLGVCLVLCTNPTHRERGHLGTEKGSRL